MKTNPRSSASMDYYGMVWRWHFYAGLLVLPVVFVLAVTGGTYLFQHEIEDMLYRDRVFLQAPYDGAVDHDAVVAAARRQYDATDVLAYTPPMAPDRSAQVKLVNARGDTLTAFLHPGDYRSLGTVDEDWRLMAIARELHRGLMLATFGRYLTELVACWTIVLIGTGVFLWWPRRNRNRGIAIPKLSQTGRNRWRELHSVVGAWVSLWVLALLFLPVCRGPCSGAPSLIALPKPLAKGFPAPSSRSARRR